jgi:hypothetical protein
MPDIRANSKSAIGSVIGATNFLVAGVGAADDTLASGTQIASFLTGLSNSWTAAQLFADGTAAAPSMAFSSSTGTGLGKTTGGRNEIAVVRIGAERVRLADASQAAFGVVVASAGHFGWNSGLLDITANTTPDLLIFRDAANTLAQRNGTNAQTSRIYNTYTDASNGEWFESFWSGNRLYLQSNQNGTGTARILDIGTSGLAEVFFQTNAIVRWRVGTDNSFYPQSDNTGDLGLASTNRIRSIYVGTSVIHGNTTGISAAGNAQGNATLLTTEHNNVTTVGAATGVRMDTAIAGQKYVVFNNGANALLIYPPTGGIINALGANAGYSLAAGSRCILFCTVGGGSAQYYTMTTTT